MSVSSARLLIEPLINEGPMRSWFHRAESPVLIVCFSSLRIGVDPSIGYELPRAATSNGRHNALFLTDVSESWLNAPGLVETFAATISHAVLETRPKRVVLIGNSMGAFSALVMGGIVRADAVLAFAPQWSVNPRLIDRDRRWMTQRRQIADWRIDHAGLHLNPNTRNILLHADAYAERFQRTPFLLTEGLDNWVMRDTKHTLVSDLKARDLLVPLIAALAAGDYEGIATLLKPLGEQIKPGQIQPYSGRRKVRT